MMRITNLVLSLFNRERDGKSYQQKFSEILEYKTATLSTIHINYDLQEAARSTFVIAFSPDRTKIATSHGNHTVKISDCFTFKVLLTLKGHPRTPWCVTFHPRINSLLASGCLGGQVRVWDLNKIADDNIVFQSQAVISSLSFHPVDDILAISTHNKIIFYDWNVQQILKTIQMKHHSESIRLVRFLPDGSKLITGITNASSQYCRPERLNVSTRGDPRGHSVVQTVSCMRMQQRCQDEKAHCAERKQESSVVKNDVNETSKSNDSCSDKNENFKVQKDDRLKHKVSCKVGLNFNNDEKTDGNDKYPGMQKRPRKDGPFLPLDRTSDSNTCTSENKPSCSKILSESSTSKKDRMSLTRKSCINFFRQPSSGYTDITASEDAGSSSSLIKAVDKKLDTSDSKSSSNQKRLPAEDKELEEANKFFHDKSTNFNANVQTSSNNVASESSSATSSGNMNSSASQLTTSVYSSNNTAREPPRGTSSVRIFIEDSNTSSNDSRIGIDDDQPALSNDDNNGSSQPNDAGESPSASRLQRTNPGRQVRSEIWNFNLGPTSSTENTTTSESLNDLDISVEGAASTIPVHGYISFPFSNMDQSTDVTNLLGVRTAVATATARSSHHVHTAVVIASQENENSETTLQTAVNRAIAGAFAGSGEGAVASNIIDTTHRLQLWDSSVDECPDIQNENKNVIVPICKIHNDSSFDVSLDSSCVAVFVPSEYGFPNDAQIKVISLKAETFLQCIYSRKYGPNAVSVSLSSLNNYLMIGLASRKLDWQLSSSQLIGQVLELPSPSHVNYEDKSKPVLNIQHKCNQNQRSNISVNTIRFHPTPGMGILYGTNRGHVQHCHIEPDYELTERRRIRRPMDIKNFCKRIEEWSGL